MKKVSHHQSKVVVVGVGEGQVVERVLSKAEEEPEVRVELEGEPHN